MVRATFVWTWPAIFAPRTSTLQWKLYHQLKGGYCNFLLLSLTLCNFGPFLGSNEPLWRQTSHTVGKPYSCSLCEYASNTSQKLNLHTKYGHQIRHYNCSECDYSCRTNGMLKIHVLSHTGEKPYSCKLCDYKSAQAAHLRTHMSIHTENRNFACELCNYKGKRLETLKLHWNEITHQKLLHCELCIYVCYRSTTLKTHMDKQTDFNDWRSTWLHKLQYHLYTAV